MTNAYNVYDQIFENKTVEISNSEHFRDILENNCHRFFSVGKSFFPTFSLTLSNFFSVDPVFEILLFGFFCVLVKFIFFVFQFTPSNFDDYCVHLHELFR